MTATTPNANNHAGLAELASRYVDVATLLDGEGAATAGNYVWRPAGSRHDAHSPDGCVVLSFFLKPNKFFDTPAS
jgi:hypothetical protein